MDLYTLIQTDENNWLVDWTTVEAASRNEALRKRPDGWRRVFTRAYKDGVRHHNG